jgi:hypothetical protein
MPLRGTERRFTGLRMVRPQTGSPLAASPLTPWPLPQLLEFAEATIRGYDDLVTRWGDTTLTDRAVPHPTAVLRLTPPV